MSEAAVLIAEGGQNSATTEERRVLRDLLSPAVGNKRAIEISARLIDQVDLLHIAKEDAVFFEHLGIEPRAISILTAAFDLSARLAEARITDRPVIENAEQVAQYLVQRYRLRDQEVFGALFLDTGGRLIRAEDLFRGSGSACVADSRFIMRRALLLSAASAILFHCHPGGTTTPSQHDLEFTRKVAKAGQHMGIRLLDHLIVAPDGQFTSMRRRRMW
ncbi:MAG: JAB domain-containing protein [Acidobacteriota bacterium]